MIKHKLANLAAPLALAGALLLATPIISRAANCDKPNQADKDKCVNMAATPELDSIILFGAGALALTGFVIVQRRRQPPH
ncbi:MAG TPA: hypothetical protein VII06_34215 [Chloroflexota bacterium]|jgi:hypothetical protein